MHLYELTKELQILQDQLYGIATELPPEEIEARLDQFGAQFEYKAEQIAMMVRNLKADAEKLDKEAEHLAARKTALENRAKSLNAYLLRNMQQLGINHVKGDILNIAVRNNPPSVAIVNLLEVPVEFTRLIPEHREVDRVKIMRHFKDTGEIISGSTIEHSQRIEIK